MSEKKVAVEKMHRVSISLNDKTYQMLCYMAENGYMNSNKPTTLAADVVQRFVWENFKQASQTFKEVDKILGE